MPDRRVEFLLIGGGVASASCAAELRRRRVEGEILLVGREPDPPYERPPCSKTYLRGVSSREEAMLHPPNWYGERDIELLTRVSAMKLDPGARTVRLSNRQEVAFGQALVATGANVRRLAVAGSELSGIHYLRALGNSDSIRQDVASCAAADPRVVLVGGSYIASEVAASLTTMGCRCTMLMVEPVVLSRGFGSTAGNFFQRLLLEHGVEVHPEQELDRFEGAEGRVTRAVTKSGLELEADLVVMGTGAVPDVMLARSAGLELGKTGGVRVDARLRTSAAGIYAAGDMAEFPSAVHGGRRLRIEHLDVAMGMGRVAAVNMSGGEEEYREVPYLFSDLADWASLEYVGAASEWDEEVVRGTPDSGRFSVWYLRDGKLAAALSVGRGEELMAARRMIVSGVSLPDAARLADESASVEDLVPAGW